MIVLAVGAVVLTAQQAPSGAKPLAQTTTNTDAAIRGGGRDGRKEAEALKNWTAVAHARGAIPTLRGVWHLATYTPLATSCRTG